MQPLATIDIKRAWHWGIAIVSDPTLGGSIPDVDPNRPVSANANGIVVLVRHAQDQVVSFEPGFEWAEAAITVRELVDIPAIDPGRRVIFEGVLATPSGRLSIGDADGNVIIPAHPDVSRLRVTALDDSGSSPDHVWIDVSPVESEVA